MSDTVYLGNPNLKKANVKVEFTQENIEEFIKCKNNPVYCARSAGQMKKFPKAAKDPNSRLRQARRRWNC